ncbi:hypothetical protein FHW67_002721 [Herbaspirillum sp. Sphag1AN]|uniref:HNH endonuclease n=1 Tax=unclassified Herbaspirillum TaxID=2624150 RepID=UPI0016185F27|nr:MULTISPECIES: HNH endonuclease [unclassified Herbaspirillum]MBB3213429.1 hypothetical protein [Herbaspirillum sp. Sphag1AN]MBB3246527.1 hypothetical protein [Herbaspirillum sp. Sphag64]
MKFSVCFNLLCNLPDPATRRVFLFWAAFGRPFLFGGARKVRLIPIYGGEKALVDDEDFERLSKYRWHLNDSGYAVRCDYSSGTLKNIRMHHEVVTRQAGFDIDHIDGNRLNNQRSNLRECTRSQNLQNQSKKRGSTSKFKGVYWLKANKKWRAKIRVSGKSKCLGLYANESDAAKAYDAAAKHYFGEFACTNSSMRS